MQLHISQGEILALNPIAERARFYRCATTNVEKRRRYVLSETRRRKKLNTVSWHAMKGLDPEVSQNRSQVGLDGTGLLVRSIVVNRER